MIVIGAHANYFDESIRSELLALGGVPDARGSRSASDDGNDAASLEIEFVENTMFWNTGPSDSLRCGYSAGK